MTTKDLSHLDALLARLTREYGRLEAATNENERAFRQREIAACHKEIDAEYKFLGIAPTDPMTDDDLLSELLSSEPNKD